MILIIVEDEVSLASILKNKFEDNGFVVSIASDGDEAFPLIKNTKPDIILLDLILPGKSGFDVLKEVKSDKDTMMIPVIILSNLGEPETIDRGMSLGATDYFVKTQHPINDIIEKVKEYLRK